MISRQWFSITTKTFTDTWQRHRNKVWIVIFCFHDLDRHLLSRNQICVRIFDDVAWILTTTSISDRIKQPATITIGSFRVRNHGTEKECIAYRTKDGLILMLRKLGQPYETIEMPLEYIDELISLLEHCKSRTRELSVETLMSSQRYRMSVTDWIHAHVDTF